jgi:hypothetical protein
MKLTRSARLAKAAASYGILLFAIAKSGPALFAITM